MTEPEKPSRSRTAWPGPTSHAGLDPGHEHDLPSSLLKRIRLLTWAVVALGVCLLVIGTSLMLILIDRGNVRNEQNERLQAEIRNSWCLALDSLPAGGLLDILRDQYDCGPGKSIDELPPEVADSLRRTQPPEPEPVPIAPPAGPKDDK